MKLSFRDLKHEKWSIEVDEADTVRQVKEKNALERGFSAEQSQKLIYSGKILKDDDAINSYKIQPDKDFIVCMVHKAKKTKSVSPAPTVDSTVSATSAVPASAGATGAGSTTPPPTAAASDAGSVLAQGSELDEIIANMVNMGYERPQVLTALRMAYNNPERAVEYLVSGMVPENPGPETVSNEASGDNSSAARAPQTASVPEASVGATGQQPTEDTTDINLFEAAGQQAEEDDEDLEFMRRYEGGPPGGQIAAFRQMIRDNPGVFEPVIQNLVAQNPQLGEVIRENPDALFQLLQGADELDLPANEDDEDEEGSGAGAWRVEITPEENDAINRLMELGFDRSIVIQAYFACDKNEELAANYLFEHGYDD